ncbi:MAG: Crp/Fnr family transcriptional regulator [Burkholderiales bacterium]
MPKHIIPIRDFLASLPLFETLEPGALARLAAGITAADAPKGTVIVRRGDPCVGFHVVVFGRVKLCLQTQRGDEKVVDLLTRGQSFGESAMFLNRAYRITAEALVDSKLLHLPRQTVMSEIERDATFAQHIIDGLSLRLSHLIGDVEGYSLRSGTQRVISYLLKQMTERGSDSPDITFPAQKGVIASQLNLTQEHFSRILHELIVAGFIEVHGRVVRILDAGELRSRAA